MKLRTLAALAAGVVLSLTALAMPAVATPPIFPFTTDHAYCKGVFHDVGVETWMRAYIRTQYDGTGQVVTSAHEAAWSQNCNGSNGSSGCGPNLNSPATQNGRLRIYAVYSDGSHTLILDRSFNLADSNACDYVAGDTTNWTVNANQVNVRWDYDLKIDNAAGDENDESMMVWRKFVDGHETWGCEFNETILRSGDDCATGDAI